MLRKIVLDTNCLLMALSSGGRYHKAWTAFLKGEYILCFSSEMLEEYEEIIALKSSPELARKIIMLIISSKFIEKIIPYYHYNLIERDPDDNKFVDCAIAANAECIVSEDKHYKVLETIAFPKVNVIRIEKFVETLG